MKLVTVVPDNASKQIPITLGVDDAARMLTRERAELRPRARLSACIAMRHYGERSAAYISLRALEVLCDLHQVVAG